MANLWRTQRPRFPLYQSDGFGRDYYIKYTNGGYWEDQFTISKKPDYERPRYRNFHSLYHMAAPIKYWGNGSGRENYILKCNGFHHDQKPLCSYQLTDFLRNDKNIRGIPYNFKKKAYLSVAESRYNQKLKNLEKKLVKRLYTEPMKLKKRRYVITEENNKEVIYNNNKCNKKTPIDYLNTYSNSEDIKNEETFGKEKSNIFKTPKIKNAMSFDANNWQNNYKNKIKLNPYKTLNQKKYDKTYYGNFGHKKAAKFKTIDYTSPENSFKYIDNNGKSFREIKFKKSSNNERIMVKNIKIV